MEALAATTTGRIALPLVGVFLFEFVVGLVLFGARRDVAWKRWLWPRYVLVAALLLGSLATALVLASGSAWALCGLLLSIPIVSCSLFSLILTARFCGVCSHFVRQSWLAPTTICLNCGAYLDAKQPPRETLLE